MPDYDLYKIRQFYDNDEDLALCIDMFQVEFLCEQLTSGHGLQCLYDVLVDINHPTEKSEDLHAHCQIMEGLWQAFTLAPGLPAERWTKPSCVR